MEGGAITNIGPPSAVLPQVEKQMLEEREGKEAGKKVEEEDKSEEDKSEEQQNQVGQDLMSELFHCHHSLLPSESHFCQIFAICKLLAV